MKLRLILIGLAVVILAAGGWMWKRAADVAAVVAEAVPPVPDLSGRVPAFREAIAKAEDQAFSLWGARGGLIRLSRLYHANGFLTEAVKCYEGLQRLEPAEPKWPHLQATIVAGYGEADAAIVLWKRTLELAPDYIPARLRLGDIELKANHTKEAEANYQAVLRSKPNEPYALLGLARIDMEAGRLDDARRKLETVVSETKFTLGYDLIVSLYEQLGMRDRAAAIRGMAKASGAYRDPPDPWLDGLLDDCYDPYRISTAAGIIARDGRAKEATELLRRAIDLSPNDVSARFQLGMLAIQQGDYQTARAQLERCTRLSPDFADPWFHLSELLAKQGDSTGAERMLSEGLKNCPQSPSLHLLRARRLRDAHRTGEAIVEFEASIRYRPNEAAAYLELGSYLVTLGRTDEAMRQFRAAVEAEPGNPMALSVLAFQAIATGDEPAARKWFERVRDQPRIERDKVENLRQLYYKQFGKSPP